MVAKSSSEEFYEDYEIGRTGIFLPQQLQSPWHCRSMSPATWLIIGIMGICKEAYPDRTLVGNVQLTLDTATDPSHPYYDEKSAQKDESTWYMVDVKFVRKLKRFIPLKELQEYKESELKDMTVIGRGRLSVQPVREKEWEFILALEDKLPQDE
jgi:predicted RNA-binding protein with PUA-like domain